MSPPSSRSSAPPVSDHLPSSKVMRYTQSAADGARSTGTRARIVSPTVYVSSSPERVIAKRSARPGGAGGGEDGHRVACISKRRRRSGTARPPRASPEPVRRAGAACTTRGQAFRSVTKLAATSTSSEPSRRGRSKPRMLLRDLRTRATPRRVCVAVHGGDSGVNPRLGLELASVGFTLLVRGDRHPPTTAPGVFVPMRDFHVLEPVRAEPPS